MRNCENGIYIVIMYTQLHFLVLLVYPCAFEIAGIIFILKNPHSGSCQREIDMDVNASVPCGGQRTTCRNHFSPSILGSRDQTRWSGLQGKHFHPLTHLCNPPKPWWFECDWPHNLTGGGTIRRCGLVGGSVSLEVGL